MQHGRNLLPLRNAFNLTLPCCSHRHTWFLPYLCKSFDYKTAPQGLQEQRPRRQLRRRSRVLRHSRAPNDEAEIIRSLRPRALVFEASTRATHPSRVLVDAKAPNYVYKIKSARTTSPDRFFLAYSLSEESEARNSSSSRRSSLIPLACRALVRKQRPVIASPCTTRLVCA